MDWDLRMPSWELGELEQNAASNIGHPSSSLGGRLDCSVDLKLGGFGDFGSPEKWKEQPQMPAFMQSSAGSSKRARAPSSGGQNVSCLVDGCKADLGNCREYYRRHKVCEAHSKTPVVMVGGQEQRFCQQCSRFHLLVEFDEAKRSCRKRLDGHNRRRRKPQPDSLNSASLFSSHQGTRFSSYQQIFASATPEPNWASIIKTEEDMVYSHQQPIHLLDRQHPFPGSSSRSYKEGKQFPFLQDSDTNISSRMSLEPSVCQPLLKANTSVESSSSSRMFCDGLTQVLNSDCALSLLSSPTQISGINLGQMVPADRIPMGQPLMPSLQYSGLGCYSHSHASNVSTTGFSCSGIEDDRVGTVLVSDGSDTDIHCQGIFHIAGEESSDGNTQALPFSWR